jgi:phosphotransferase system enzyme I (PtsI)
VVILNPSESTLFRYGKIQEQKKSFEARLLEVNRQPAVTLDGVTVSLMANIEKAEEVTKAKATTPRASGFYRTEFLFLNTSRVPSEQEQFLAYKSVVEAMTPLPVIIRTLDLGGDKPMAGKSDWFPKENNPFMGFRAIRFCLEHQDVFKDQLRAILRASVFGKVS